MQVTGAEIFIADTGWLRSSRSRLVCSMPLPCMRDLISRCGAGIILWWPVVAAGLAVLVLMIYLHDKGYPRRRLWGVLPGSISTSTIRRSSTTPSKDILPWSIPVTPYLHGLQPNDKRVPSCTPTLTPTGFRAPSYTGGADEMLRDGIRIRTAFVKDNGIAVWAMEEYGMSTSSPSWMPWAEASKRVFQFDRLSVVTSGPTRRSAPRIDLNVPAIQGRSSARIVPDRTRRRPPQRRFGLKRMSGAVVGSRARDRRSRNHHQAG